MKYECTCGAENLVYEHAHEGETEYIMVQDQEVRVKCDQCGKTSAFWIQVVEKDEKWNKSGRRRRGN